MKKQKRTAEKERIQSLEALCLKLANQNEEMRKDLESILPYARIGGWVSFLCLSCGMPTYTGQSYCNLCPLDISLISKAKELLGEKK